MSTPQNDSVSQANVTVGIIGMGDMGRLYARKISQAGWKVIACDTPEKYAGLKAEFEGGGSPITIVENGHLVSRCSDYIIYNVPAESIDAVVKLYGPSTKMGAIVGGQTSCKAPEIAAFEAHLPSDVEIISCHSLHGPRVDSRGQPLAVISHRASAASTELVTRILACLQSKIVYLSALEHDRITADTQAVTHAAFLSMGTAWQANAQFPWEVERYSTGGVENVKINIMMRIYSNKWHVYAGLAILNPAARDQIRAYADSVTELFKLMISHKRKEFEERIFTAGEAVFGRHKGAYALLRDEILDQYSLAETRIPKNERRPNSHLSLLAMVDCWWKLGIIPYEHMICETPLFRLWLGVAEYLYRDRKMLEEAIETAMEDDAFRMDDLEFTFAARGWSEAVGYGDFEGYRKRFEKVQTYFAPRVAEATRLGNEMIAKIFEKTREGEHEAKSS
ncbi:prephenate dehydrogenase (NADP(+)) [Orbilia brochopaga]|uniref:Prephenate dehydrogenase [NADP(+)] n=1 Tax=Orbilia brochopaga TaxID=3140254 RepID=A0AAV9UZB0_9PEZI